MRPARILLLVVALLAAGLAAFLVTRGTAPAPQLVTSTEVVQEAKTQILVAKAPIGVGERLSPASVEWADWPEGAVRPDYVTIAAMPEAVTDMSGAVARFEFFTGEPIREIKLVRSDQGYLSAVLEKGMRGVSISIAAASGAGGFIVPNDRVDVVLTRSTPVGQLSETILSNVKVLAIGKKLGEVGATAGQTEATDADPQSKVFSDVAIATLELDPAQGEAIINAAAIGRLSLALRSVADFKEVVGDMTNRQEQSSTVRVIRFGKETAVLPTSSQSGGNLAEQTPGVEPGSSAIITPPTATVGPVLQ
jgi:pilus assembly protein CpaB